ncbi:Phosphatidylinositol 4-phosphate 5-kinase-like protein 1 [Triplophysa tibetana]|uniref:Phosphatidylinositol 4-phosphate 5-kinase-like protein 1 n=1 Tax=Triplophysa tibetana TaxID=1572043 RepID=A0A5A9NXD8_9TELE|nr:Phosphatidylinositol 4-phosphate 5-kinase-like protein 1 [Triplophysa tibetana]
MSQRSRSSTRRRQWAGVMSRWTQLGVFEIDEEHEFYELNRMMKRGLSAAVQNAPDDPASGFRMQTFAGPAFANLRRSVNISEEEYETSLASPEPYLQFISNSKSKADFFITYDIKGCEVGRWTDPTPKKDEAIVILKDMNFEGQHITLGEESSWMVRQVKIDTAFLRSLNVLDYSLLLAHQPLHKDEVDQKHHLANLVSRTAISLDQNLPTHAHSFSRCSEERDSHTLVSHSQDPQQMETQNRRLLPDFRNPLHVIDGPHSRYFVGIIDIFTEYGLKKKLENLWKRMKYPRRAFSTVSPSAYSLRFVQWVEKHTK